MIARPASLFPHSGIRFPFLAVLLAAGLTVVYRHAHSRRPDVAGHVAFRVLLGGLVSVGDVGVCLIILKQWVGHAPA